MTNDVVKGKLKIYKKIVFIFLCIICRWDVQRIREQRVIEKLKQRQDRTGSGSRTEDLNEQLQSLWPTIDDIRYLEVSEQLPVSAFGCPIPRFTPR